MISVVKPKKVPDILKTKGRTATRRLCRQHARGEHDFQFRSSIYAARSVKSELEQCQHSKCAFCESFFMHVGYGDVEHFRPKAGYKQVDTDPLEKPGYYWLAYAWKNLFYSCQLCNQQFKKNLFPLRDPELRARTHKHDIFDEDPLLIDPTRDDPSELIQFVGEVAHHVEGQKKGEVTIQVLGLNRDELIEERLRRLEDLQNLNMLCELLEKEYQRAPTEQNAADLKKYRTRLQQKVQPTCPYSAMARDFLDSVHFK
jgi:uncharacterized protein (TIGR02646 family)